MIALRNNETTLDQLARMMADGFERMENRFEVIDRRFEDVDRHFDSLEKRFDILAKESMRLGDDMQDVKNNLSSLVGMYVEHENRINTIDQRTLFLESETH